MTYLVDANVLSEPTKLEQWFDALTQTIECLPWDAAISRRWAGLVASLKK